MPESRSVQQRVAAPTTDRPRMPGYGIATTEEGMLPWSWASQRLEGSRNYWVCTTRPDGRPHAMPVWGVWVDGALYFSTGRQTRKARNLATNSAIVVHLESGDDAVILEGTVEEVADRALLGPADTAYAMKYIDKESGKGYHIIPEANEESLGPVFVLRPQVAFGWMESEFARSPTRWRFGV